MEKKRIHRPAGLAGGPQGFMSLASTPTTEKFERAVAEMNASALLNNFRCIMESVPDHEILPMVKANAYGHGLEWAGRELMRSPQLYGFGVATLVEGAELRSALGAQGRKVPIIVFSESSPWSDEIGSFCEANGLTTVIYSEEDWARFLKGGWNRKIPYELQFNTGMNRLGFSPSYARTLARQLKNKAQEQPTGVFSHLAISEVPDAKLTLSQVEKFKAIRRELAEALPTARFHMANSGGIWNHKSLGLQGWTDVVRPGLSLYGVPPWPNAPERGLKPVMTLKARVMAVHRLKAGDTVGYGATYRVTGNQPVYVAIVGAGYADGIKRSLSNQGHAWLDGRSTRFLGIVSMDLCAVQATAETKVGSWVEFLGPHVDPWGQAKAAGTIPYELLTGVSPRVKRNSR